MSLSEEDTQKITDALLAGRKIEAIKIYRAATGLGLGEAKDFVDELMAELREQYPDKFKSEAKGCAIVLIAGTFGIGVLAHKALYFFV